MPTPPLNALRTFEVAARHLSFTLAAEELNITQAAVSQQIRQLEDILGVRLFKRLNRSLLLTDAGQEYAMPIRHAIQTIQDATHKLSGYQDSGILTISVLPSFAARWLVPRIGHFRQKYPDIDLRLHTSFTAVDFQRDRVDAAIRLGHWEKNSERKGLYGELIMREFIFPVSSPDLMNGTPPLRRPEDMRFHTLLQDEYIDWDDWFKEVGVSGFNTHKGPAFFDSAMSMQAAIDGIGIALGRTPLVARDFKVGRLVAPFDLRVQHKFAYRLVCPKGDEDNPKILAFRTWLHEEIAQWKLEISADPMLSLDGIVEYEDD